MSVRAEPKRGWALLRALPLAMLLGLVVGLQAGCVNEDQVFVDRAALNLPSDTLFNFLGYVDREDTLTFCGNCHATFQASWKETGHAGAWDGLQNSGHPAPYCEACHTVSQLGNTLVDSAGWTLTQDERYLDVQCESCHGPGFAHVQDPLTAVPLASIEAGAEATVGCGECHNGAHHPFVEQWAISRHGTVPAWEESSTVLRLSSCRACHEGRTALANSFYEPSDYLEKEDAEANQPIVCVVCHDPHGTDVEGNLRASISMASTDNLCVRCHSNQGVPPNEHGPHAAQGLLVLGENVGWLPPDLEIPDPTHADNENLCASCHLATFTVEDPAFTSVGHTFAAIACLDEQGRPTTGGDCDVRDRDFRACAECHVDEVVGRGLYQSIKAELNGLLDQLWDDDNGDCVMDTFGVDFGLLPLVLQQLYPDTTELDPRDGVVTVAEGAYWNAQLAFTSDRTCFEEAYFYAGLAGEDTIPGTSTTAVDVGAHKASGDGVHNPALLVALLEASIDAVIGYYSLP